MASLLTSLFCALAASASADQDAPVITLDLAAKVKGKFEFLKSDKADKSAIPCSSLAANKAECNAGAGDKTYYAFCYVGVDNALTCPEPEANAHDHHDGDLAVQKKVMQVIDSPKHSGPKMVHKIVSHIDYNKRGEYRLIFDAQDRSGNKADTVYFHFFIVDHEKPTITVPAQKTLAAFPVNNRFFNLKFQASDNYDGDVSDTLQIKVTKPNGLTQIHKAATLNIDTHKRGKYNLFVTAHDYASAFGKNYKSNGVARSGYVYIHKNRKVTVHFGPKELNYTPKPEAPIPVKPKKAYHKLEKHHTYIPPVIMLFDSDTNALVGRGSAFGADQTETKYRTHLRSMGLSKEEEEMHVADIVAREQRLAKLLGPAAKWHDSGDALMAELPAHWNVEVRFGHANDHTSVALMGASGVFLAMGMAMVSFSSNKRVQAAEPCV